MSKSFSIYAVIVALTVAIVLNPLTYGVVFSTDDGAVRLLRQLSLLLLDGYLGLVVVMALLYVRFAKRRWFLALIALLLLLVPYLVASEIALVYYRLNAMAEDPLENRNAALYAADPELGWVPRLNSVITESFPGGVEVSYEIDAEGRKAIPTAGPAGRRLHFFGDSYIFGTGVSNRHTALNLLADRVGEGVSVFNYAVPAYGLEQMYGRLLRHIDQVRHGDAVIFAPLSYDVLRNLIMKGLPCTLYYGAPLAAGYDSFPSFGPDGLSYPKLSDACSLVRDYILGQSPLLFGKLYRRYRTWRSGDAYLRNADAIFQAARATVEARGARFHVIFVPTPSDCEAGRYAFDISGLQTRFQSMLKHCPNDPESLRRLRSSYDYHWSLEGNRWAAKALETILVELELALGDQPRPRR